MADYFPLIARAVSGLDPTATAEARQSLYARAREALRQQLTAVDPPLSDSEISAEERALEQAILEVETVQFDGDTSRLSSDQYQQLKEQYRSLSDLSNTEWLRGLLNWTASSHEKLPPISAIPDQDEDRAIAFRPTRRGPLDLQPDPVHDPLDPEQSQLYLRIRAQLENLKEDIPSQEREQINGAINDFLDQPPTWEQVEFKKVLWLCGNALRQSLAQHDAVQSLSEPHYSKLPPGVAESLRRPVEAWNVFVLGDPELVRLDAKRVGPQEQSAAIKNINAARPILEVAISDRDITTEQAGKALEVALKVVGTPNDDINKRQAQDLADGTSQNLITLIIRRAYIQRENGDQRNADDNDFLTEYKRGVAKAAGALTVSATAGAVALSIPYAMPFLEFVARNAGLLREYVAIAFQNNQLGQVIDAIEFTWSQMKMLKSDETSDPR